MFLDPPSIEDSVPPNRVLQLPPRIEELHEIVVPTIVFLQPDPINEHPSCTVLHKPPTTDELNMLAFKPFLKIVLELPPRIEFHQESCIKLPSPPRILEPEESKTLLPPPLTIDDL